MYVALYCRKIPLLLQPTLKFSGLFDVDWPNSLSSLQRCGKERMHKL